MLDPALSPGLITSTSSGYLFEAMIAHSMWLIACGGGMHREGLAGSKRQRVAGDREKQLG